MQAATPSDDRQVTETRMLPDLHAISARERAALVSQITGCTYRKQVLSTDEQLEKIYEERSLLCSAELWQQSLDRLPRVERARHRKKARELRSVLVFLEKVLPIVCRCEQLRQRVSSALQDYGRTPTAVLLATIHDKKSASWALYDHGARPDVAAQAVGLSVAQAHNYLSQWRPHRVERIALRTDTSKVRDEYDRVWLVREALAALDAAREIGHAPLTTRAVALAGAAMGVS